jgi:queuosine precursor transporter
MRATLWALAAVLGYIGSVAAANWLTATYGLVPVGFGLLATAGTYAAGLAFIARDAVQDAAGRVVVLAALAVGAGLSWWLSTPALALASAAAFGLSELVDMAIYTPLRKRGYIRAAVASNLVGSIVDTVVFLQLAGFGLATLVVAGQLVGKAWVTVGTVGLVVMVRALLRHRVRPKGV